MKFGKYLLWSLTVLFFTVMAVLTVTARSVHNASLPHVTVDNPVRTAFTFTYTDEEGNTGETAQKRLSIPKELAGQPVYIVYEDMKNGEKRTFVQEVFVETGMENEAFVEVISGLSREDRIVVAADKNLWDGAEVYVE